MRNTTHNSIPKVAAVAPRRSHGGSCAAYQASGVGSGCVQKPDLRAVKSPRRGRRRAASRRLPETDSEHQPPIQPDDDPRSAPSRRWLGNRPPAAASPLEAQVPARRRHRTGKARTDRSAPAVVPTRSTMTSNPRAAPTTVPATERGIAEFTQNSERRSADTPNVDTLV